MKTKSVVLAGMMVMASIFSFAIEPSNSQLVVVSQKKTGMFKVIYQGTSEQNVVMKIYGKGGEVVFKETIKSVKGFIRPVNFNGMDAGEYIIEIADENGKQLQRVGYKTETNVKSVHVSKVSEEGKYLLAVANDGAEQINVRIFDGDNNLVHNENMTINGNFGLVYNLKQVVGKPTFEITDNTGNTKVIK
jgi:hypothetical protein